MQRHLFNNLDFFFTQQTAAPFWATQYLTKYTAKINVRSVNNNSAIAAFNVFFLKKEKIYTKLKYSRVPQYDIVSGGIALMLSGFLGFLICEKFGFELIDSGDFYFLFIYIVFVSFFLRILIKLVSFKQSFSSIFSIKLLIVFVNNWFRFFLKKIY